MIQAKQNLESEGPAQPYIYYLESEARLEVFIISL